MPLWDKTDDNLNSGKPKFLNSGDQDKTYAGEGGWTINRAGEYTDVHGNVRTKEEVLVAYRGLQTDLGAATLGGIAFDKVEGDVGDTFNVVVSYNEPVNVVAGNPTLPVQVANTTANTVPSSSINATYQGTGNTTNRLYFQFTAFANAASYSFAAGGVNIANTQASQIVDNSDTNNDADLTVPGLYTGANSAVGTLITS